ncbi:MAG: aromatic ring-hydroxylating dioxygenase subunit alpha [Alphaproteobacteria bacterium]|nr:aromatic ring-hydroxylating dioxygenase subunit alpha [Alphaproteobacteria bacterium]
MLFSEETPDELLADLDRGISLPAHWYTDSKITEQELAHIFRSSWHYVGPAAQLANRGDYVTGQAGRVPVVVVRNDQGLSAFINVCRHRRHIIMKGRGQATSLQCPYHAWTYDLQGGLKRAPRAAAGPELRLEELGLLPARVETLGPFVFVTLDLQARPLADCYGSVLQQLAKTGVRPGELECHSREEWRFEANWKTMIENYLECYHCPVAHPGFSAAIDVRPDRYKLHADGLVFSQAGEVRPSALEGKTRLPLYDLVGEIKESQYYLLWPNTTINVNPGFPNLSIDVWIPDGANATKGFSEQYFAPGVDAQFARDLIAFNKQVAHEDETLTDSVQRGLLGGLPGRGQFLVSSEHLVVGFQRMVVEALRDTKGR